VLSLHKPGSLLWELNNSYRIDQSILKAPQNCSAYYVFFFKLGFIYLLYVTSIEQTPLLSGCYHLSQSPNILKLLQKEVQYRYCS